MRSNGSASSLRTLALRQTFCETSVTSFAQVSRKRSTGSTRNEEGPAMGPSLSVLDYLTAFASWST